MRFAPIALLGLAACQGNQAPLRADVPIQSDDRSLILGFRRDASLTLEAFDLIDGQISPALMVPIGDEDSGQVYALSYRETLAALDLLPGPIPLVSGSGPVRALPTPTRIHTRTLELGSLGEWQTETSLDSPLSEVRLPVGCSRFEVASHPLPDGLEARFMVAAGDRALIGNTAGDLYLAHSDGRFTKASATGAFFDAYATSDGTIYLGGEHGEVHRATVEPGESNAVTITLDSNVGVDEDIWHIVGDPRADASERAVVTEGGFRIEHGPGGWRSLYQRGSSKDLSWMGPGLVRAIFGYEYYTLGPSLIAGPEREDEVHVQLIDGGLSALGYAPLVGPLAGTEYGAIYVRKEEDDWEVVVGLEAAMLQIRGLIGYRFGFLYARTEGIVEVEGLEPCPTQLVGATNSDGAEIGVEVVGHFPPAGRAELMALGRDVLVIGTKGLDRTPHLFWLSGR